MNKNAEESGLNTRDALNKLVVEIEATLRQMHSSQKTRGTKSWLKDTLSPSSQHSTINWISSVFIIWTSICLFIKYAMDSSSPVLIFESILIIFMSIVSVSLELYDNKLRHDEIPNRVRTHLQRIKTNLSSIKWKQYNYPDLSCPLSPCITLQWTYRDGNLVNLPWSLLVKEDIISMRPGQISPGYCEAVDKNNDIPIVHAKEVYAPSMQNANEIFSVPKSRQPLECKTYRLLETPYLNNLKIYLEQALERPITQLNQHRHLLMIGIIERFALPITFFTVVAVNLFRYFTEAAEFLDLIILWPVNAILPLLPLTFPIAWNLINYFGLAKFKTVFDTTRLGLDCRKNQLEEDTETAGEEECDIKCNPAEVWRNFVRIIKGKADILVHSSNILHVLGSVTALGCVDKKGILSWPNPSAEKVFFLHNNENLSPASSLGNVVDLAQDSESVGDTPHHNYNSYESPNMATAEVLDLTHNHNDPFKLHFDDHDWHRHISSLKPLGLAILLNTCNVETQERYTAFCSHITCEAIYNEALVPVTNRRCLCELANEIGFLDQAQKIFSLETQLSTFRHLQPEMVRRDNKYARSLQLSTKLKFPFPHMFAVVVKELSTGSMQLLSEGTADIILDSCVDYWDGHDLCPLSHSDRKRIQDFYQRSSLTAYCTAFAYRPLDKCVSAKLGGLYLELPSDSRHLYMNFRSPTPVHWECKSVLEPRIKTPLGQFYSTDSLLYNECPAGEVSDAESCFQVQCNQIFIGMVTMQYQPLTDMVQLIEQLERACIRFVHFSKENELRSRVFSEKMGLESGWNCHISLLSERNNSNLESSRTMSFSAPSAINMEHSVVKFDTEQERMREAAEQTELSTGKLANRDTEINTSHDWQSLSCLTDSTEQSAPINFDMSNRAKLPRGIDKIRPHIELIDNVPLLVSLFTDCTPNATREMLHIMQDYGEIVCILGSSANNENAGIFMQADASIAVDPLYPQVCEKLPVYEKTPSCPSPQDLSTDLNSVACCLTLKREDPVSLYHLVIEARHFVTSLWNCLQFWLSCCLVLSLVQLLAMLAMLPAIFATGQVLYLSSFVVPALSLSLIGPRADSDVMKKPLGKKQMTVGWDVGIFILWCYGLKFLPTVLVVLVSSLGILAPQCWQLCELRNCTCTAFYVPSDNVWHEEMDGLKAARVVNTLIVLVHFVVISGGFVHRDCSMHKQLPFRNYLWLVTVLALILIQILYTTITFCAFDAVQIPIWVIIFASVSPIFLLIVNELVKHEEIKVNKRYRKRIRLDFGTKLGMNSPF